MKIKILGPLEMSAAGRQVDCDAMKPRTMLGLLLCQANRAVPLSVLREALWDDAPPRTAHKNLQSYVSTLRALLTDSVPLVHRPPGYLLRVGPEELDALRFVDLARQGRLAARNGHPETAADLLGQAIRLWRGPVLPDLVSVPAIAAGATQLRERYLVAYEDWAEASLALGRHADLIDGLDELCWEHPFRERLRHAQMLALYRAGRQTEALAQYDTIRQALARELGLTPGPLLTRLHEAILAGDRSLDIEPPGRTRTAAPRCAATEADLARTVADFTGRDREAGVLLNILGAPAPAAVVTVTGAAGVGKTALAVHCAHRLGSRYPDGRVLVRLRAPDGSPRTEADLVAELLQGLGHGPVPTDGPTPAALLREATAARRVLFVLDDAAGEEQVGSLLCAAGDAAVLVTSRRRLMIDAAVHLRLEPMTVTESVSLLGRRIGAQRVAAEGAAAARLAGVCGGLPLAVRVVGAKLAALPHLSLSRYADRITGEGQVLDQLRAGDHQVYTRLTQWLGEATPDDRAALRRLAALDGAEFTLDDAAAVLGVDTARAEGTVERLIESHFVEARAAEVQAHAAAPTLLALAGLLRALLREGDALPAGAVPLVPGDPCSPPQPQRQPTEEAPVPSS
ncbi:AfsR/SARP family transcriptional regulator [Micromonospora carbonacea]|uniref:AfsR/SARP family transcriptional regulator n=1 Tax=Micromonospora carbonacea TaxID=47853 RepID=UPI0033F52B87